MLLVLLESSQWTGFNEGDLGKNKFKKKKKKRVKVWEVLNFEYILSLKIQFLSHNSG
jgi:hypothetical protein